MYLEFLKENFVSFIQDVFKKKFYLIKLTVFEADLFFATDYLFHTCAFKHAKI